MKKTTILIAKMLVIVAILASFTSCKKTKPLIVDADITFKVGYKVDAAPLTFNNIQFTNAAGNEYSVTRLDYFLSHFVFHNTDGSTYLKDAYQYLNAQRDTTNEFTLKNIPNGDYSGITFYLGLDENLNVTMGLPNEPDYNNMEWPVPMGGGYHFMKLEGHFKSGPDTYGYAMHIGLNYFLVSVHIDFPFTINELNRTVNMHMNVNEWFENPNIYNFETDKVYSMGDTTAMLKLTQNGANTFSITSIE